LPWASVTPPRWGGPTLGCLRPSGWRSCGSITRSDTPAQAAKSDALDPKQIPMHKTPRFKRVRNLWRRPYRSRESTSAWPWVTITTGSIGRWPAASSVLSHSVSRSPCPMLHAPCPLPTSFHCAPGGAAGSAWVDRRCHREVTDLPSDCHMKLPKCHAEERWRRCWTQRSSKTLPGFGLG